MSAHDVDRLAQALRSDDPDTRALALGELIERGPAATAVLVAALGDAAVEVRQLAAEGLGLCGATDVAPALLARLDDPDEIVRSRAALALARLGHPQAEAALIRTLDDNYDLLRAHLSLSAYALMARGPGVLPAIAPLLDHVNERVRVQARFILSVVLERADTGDWRGLQAILAGYAADAPPAERARVAATAAAWLAAHPDAEHGHA